VVLTYAKDLEAELVGELRLCNDLPQSLACRGVWISDLGNVVSPSSMLRDTSRRISPQ
jgi:hypothetical protein